MAFEFILSTDEIREKMFEFIKPVYKKTMDSEVDYINWIYGVYDSENGFFITYVNLDNDNKKYILISEKGKTFYIIAHRYNHTLSKIPVSIMLYCDIIQDGIKLYNKETLKKRFMSGYSDEQKQCFDKITENMKDRCRPAIDINSYEDAEKLFYKDDFNYSFISHMYTKNTVANFNKYMSNKKMCTIRGQKYRNIISKISEHCDMLNKEDYEQISKDFREASYLNNLGTDDIFVKMTIEVIEKAYRCGVVSNGYIGFIADYIKNCIKKYSDKIQSLSPLIDFMNEHMRDENFKELEFYRKELEKLVYKKVEGFQFVLTTDGLRMRMFNFLKPKYKSINDWNVTNINWTTGVYDRKSGIFLTKIYYLSDGIARCGVDSYSYIVIDDNGNVFRVDNDYEYEKRAYNFKIPKQYETLAEKIKKGIEFYRNDYKYRSTLSEETEKKLKEIKSIMDERCHQSFFINCEEDARKLFELVNFNDNIINETYNKKTISDFKKNVSEEKLLSWRGNQYFKLINEVRSVIVTDNERYRSFEIACYHFGCGVSEIYDEEFLKTVKYMYNACIMVSGVERKLKNYINTYIEDYPDRLKNIVPLVKFLKTRAEDKDLKDTIEKVEKILNK